MVNKRAHVTYSGKVHGVGFRWSAQSAANSAGVFGWVRNCPDGTVEVICEGEKGRLDAFLQRIKNEMGHCIEGADVAWEDYKGEFDTFSIK